MKIAFCAPFQSDRFDRSYQLLPALQRCRLFLCLQDQRSRDHRYAVPAPLYEIYVHPPRMEGIHLRGGKVARGGIRWSDRPDDFRTEVLGLMKTQMTKNALIVPVGSKGGFVVKTPFTSREEAASCRGKPIAR